MASLFGGDVPREPAAAGPQDGTSQPAPEATTPICRICRGEGTTAEPLFYPCKCSGSIKFVHQECLMEWLSHSQKKYCELCKTSFRFTKLYAPDMPQSLPMHVFFQHMAKHLFWNVVVWLRAILTISIWVGWLPYFMRGIWAFMFWVSNEGLGSTTFLYGGLATSLFPGGDSDPKSKWFTIAMTLGEECPATPLLAPTTTSVKLVELAVQYFKKHNIPDRFISIVLSSINAPTAVKMADVPSGWFSLNSIPIPSSEPTTLLSKIAFFRNLTRSNAVNRTVIAVMEGQIITVLVIICFILVILVRDYVIQQQPDINGREDDGAVDDLLQDVPIPNADPIQPPNVEEHRPNAAAVNIPNQADADTEATSEEEAAAPERRVDNSSFEFAFHFGPMVYPEVWRAANPTIAEYLLIYRRGLGDPDEVLRLLLENPRPELLPWVHITQQMIVDRDEELRRQAETGDADGEVGTSEPELRLNMDLFYRNAEDALQSERSPTSVTSPDGGNVSVGPAEEPGAPRPRAASDGPTGESSLNPLANNSWTFEDHQVQQQEPEPASSSTKPFSSSSWTFDDLPTSAQAYAETSLGHAMSGRASPEHTQLRRDHSSSSSIGHVYSSGLKELDSPPSDRTTAVDAAESFNAPDLNIPHLLEFGHSEPGPTTEEGHNEIGQEQIEQMPMFVEPAPVGEAPVDPEPIPDITGHAQHTQLNQANGGVANTIADFMWGFAEEDDFGIEAMQQAEPEMDDWEDVPIEGGQLVPAGEDIDADEAAAMDEELAELAIQDMEDFEGVMELIGMRGPIAGLFQNAIFCAVLVSVTIFACIFVPYNIGRISLWIVANPARVAKVLIEVSKVIQDALILILALGSWMVMNLVELFVAVIPIPLPSDFVQSRGAMWDIWRKAGVRVAASAFFDFPLSAAEMQNFSVISHEALYKVKDMLALGVVEVLKAMQAVYTDYIRHPGMHTLAGIPVLAHKSFQAFIWLLTWPLSPDLWLASLEEPASNVLLDPELANWSAADRFWAILAGYLAMFCIAAMYLNRESAAANNGRGWEAGVVDVLNQASGIMKVILIISIEMLVFPLYCGILLDFALLPLFEGASLSSRGAFTYNHGVTSAFVHWFVGTGYMFHFALFISMCRKIVRPGVLYFIRDPDDPEFHPVREVLEKKLTTQLRKILYSAFIYGGLVLIGLGSIVWGVYLCTPSVLPVHYSSNEPVLEFPVDLLFYNFLVPLAFKFFQPTEAIFTVYNWWFRRCARGLRLTYFIFGERRIDEEGVLHLPADSEHPPTLYNQYFLELDEQNRVVPKTWRDTFEGSDSKPNPKLSKSERKALRVRKSFLVSSGQLVKDGRFVRAPASDRLKLAKGLRVFLDVSDRNNRADKADAVDEEDIYDSKQYQFVYLPPSFRTRAILFVFFVWLFAAVTGVGVTVLPLALGRMLFKMLIPDHVRTNDIYAFSIGICVLGSIAYVVLRFHIVAKVAREWANSAKQTLSGSGAVRRIANGVQRAFGLIHTYFFLLVVFPLLVSTFLEAYLLMPLNTYMNPPTEQLVAQQEHGLKNGQHSIHITQSWVLGLLYLKLASTIATSLMPGTRFAIAVERIMWRGWRQPNVSLFTRALVIPGLVVAVIGLVGPPWVAGLCMRHNIFGLGQNDMTDAQFHVRAIMVHRYAYPVAAVCAILVRNLLSLARVVDGWTVGIRDEAYLIGERLHNFGAATSGTKKGSNAWKASSQRLG